MDNWENADGEPCPTCGTRVLRLFGPLRQCRGCLAKEHNVVVEEVNCPKCSSQAALVTSLLDGGATSKIICPECGTLGK